jgi:hypothetical protein
MSKWGRRYYVKCKICGMLLGRNAMKRFGKVLHSCLGLGDTGK